MSSELRIPKNRLESFSDGVLAIIITIMVLELRAPHGTALSALRPVLPQFLSYGLSFVYVAIYWNNHHHLLHTLRHLNARIMWANAHLLFWLSLIPFATEWMGLNHGASWPTAVYGGVLLMSAVAYFILQGCIVDEHGPGSLLARTIGRDWKGKFSLAAYTIAVLLAFVDQRGADALYVLVALLWLVPDRRMEKVLAAS